VGPPMIPIQDINTPRKQRFPFVNLGLILLNIIVFVKEVTIQPAAEANCFVYSYSFDPAVLANKISVPAAYTAYCPHSAFHPPWAVLTIFTAMFLHASILHIAGNMIFLYVFGDNVEDRLGHLGYLLFYLACGVAAAIVQTIAVVALHAGPADLPNLGASGAIAGVLGSYLLLFPRAKIRTLVFLGIIFFFTTLSAVLVILAWFALQLLDGYLTLNSAGAASGGGVAYFAHIGGFAFGFVLTLLLKPILAKQPTPDYMAT
jgi:membrane associated rhomboid family serine protease